MVTRKSVLVSGILAVLLLAGGLVLLSNEESSADDATHTTVFHHRDAGAEPVSQTEHSHSFGLASFSVAN